MKRGEEAKEALLTRLNRLIFCFKEKEAKEEKEAPFSPQLVSLVLIIKFRVSFG
jgi:hypothetical protein